MDMRKIITKKIDDGIMCCDFELWLHKNCIKCKCELLSHDSINPDYKYKFLSYQALLAIISSLNKIYIL